LEDLLPKVNDEKIGEKSTPDWVNKALPVLSKFQMLQRKLSDISVLQKLAYGSHGLRERETLEVAQSDVDTTELTYLIRRGANHTDWLSSKIVSDLGCVEVLETTTRGNSPKGRDGTSRDASKEVLVILVAVIQHVEGLLG
jgi:hypothetical protein